MRAPCAPDEVQQREGDRDPDAPEHAEHRDAGERDHREPELRAPPAPQPQRAPRTSMNPRTATMTIAASVAIGRSCTSPVPKISRTARTRGADEPGDLAAGADVLGDRGARAAGREREPLEEPGRDVRHAEHRELLVLVDLLAEPPGVAARQDARVGERDERDPDRRGDERLEVLERDVGHAERGQAAGDRADHRDLVGEAERADERRRADDRDEDAGHPRRDAPQAEDQRERADADRERRRVRLVEPRDEVAHRRDEALRARPRSRRASGAARRSPSPRCP